MSAQRVSVVVKVPRCPDEVLTTAEVTAITNAVLADNLHTLVHAHTPCLIQGTTVRVETFNVNE